MSKPKSIFLFIICGIIFVNDARAWALSSCVASPTSVNFGNVLVGGTNAQSVTLTNNGIGPVNVLRATASGPGFTVSGPSLPLLMLPGQTAIFNVAFAPTAAGSAAGTISISSTASNSPATVQLSGTGSTPPPTSPTNLSATAVSPTQINLGWTASTSGVGIAHYNVQRCQGPGCTNFALVATPGATTYSDAGLNPGTTYAYRIQALDQNGNVSSFSNVAAATTPGAGVLTLSPGSMNFGAVVVGSSKTQNGTLTNTGSSGITISQASVSGREFTLSGLSTPLALAPNQSTSFAVTFTPGTAGAVTGNVSFASNAANTPTAGSLSGTGTHAVTLSWQASTSAVIGYNVYRSPTSGGPYTKVNPSLISSTSFSDTAVQSAQTYYYVATAVDSNSNESVHSNEAAAPVP